MTFKAAPLPVTLSPKLAAYLGRELRSLELAFASLNNLTLPALAAEPERIQNGMVVYANGTDWNPGSGAGFYGREAGAWVKL